MRTDRRILWTAVVITAALVVAGLASSTSAQEMYKMSGEITDVSPQHNTVVVEVPMGKEMFTVAGPLAADAKLMKKGRQAQLSDFQTGEDAMVTFHSNMKGHVIDRLEVR